MGTLSIQQINEDGLDVSFDAADSGGDTFANDNSGRTFLRVKNGDSTTHTVTIAATQSSFNDASLGKLRKEDISVSIPAGEERDVGPIRSAAFGSKPDIQYDAVSSVEVAAIKV